MARGELRYRFELRLALVLGDELAVYDGLVKLARFEQVDGGIRLLDDLRLDLRYINVVRVPVVLVLDHGDATSRVELGHLVGTVVEQIFDTTRIIVALLLHELLLLRVVGEESGETKPVRCRGQQRHLERLVVRSLDSDVVGTALARVILVRAFHERRDDVSVDGRRLGIERAEPGVLEVMRRNRVPVRPLDAVTQGERVVESVPAYVYAFGHIWEGSGVRIQPVQARRHVLEYLGRDHVIGGRGVQIFDGIFQVDDDGLAAPATTATAAAAAEDAAARCAQQGSAG